MLGDYARLAAGVPVGTDVSDGVEVRGLCKLVKLFHTKLGYSCLFGPGLVHVEIRAFATKLEAQILSTPMVLNTLQSCYHLPTL